ncbi:bcl-2-like protein 1 [Clytia hemisphaerica]|uniref:Bcl-2 Bcl-2 homology region 1-3 domain-containing protein n=1 Tax=Clytia hemisphaerica TaxID=252671 RepID=A0A7M5X3L1_9CNID|eukprot:TCONS_00026999-protein
MADVVNMNEFNEQFAVNFNTEEAKIAKEVAQQFVVKLSGGLLKTTRRETEVMLKLVADANPQQVEQLSNLVSGIKFTEENGYRTLMRMCESLFGTGINWGRIITLFLYVSLLIDDLHKAGKDTFNDRIGHWLGCCIAKQAPWIKENGGWAAFLSSMGGASELKDTVFKGLFNVTLGLGTIAAALYIKGR